LMASELSSEEYIERHNIHVYLRDVVQLLLKARDERPLEFISEYFNTVLNGTHVLLREYSYVNSCARNRWDFIKSVWEAFAELPAELEVTPVEMTELIQLLCPDFPFELVSHAALLCGDRAQHAFGVLMHAFCVRFYFAEFLERTAEVFCTCDTRACGQVNRNVLCLTLRQMMHSAAAHKFSCPPPSVFDQVLQVEPNSHRSEIRLLEMQSELIVAPAMRESLSCGISPTTSSLIPSLTLSPARARTASSTTITRLLDEMRISDGGKKRSDRSDRSERRSRHGSRKNVAGSACASVGAAR